MELRGGVLQFYEMAGGRYPKDLALFQAASKFAKEQLAEPLDMAKAAVLFVVYVQDGEEIEVLGLGGLQQIWDAFLFRVKPSKYSTRTTKELWRRMNDLLANAGISGQEVLLYFNPEQREEQRCPQADEWLGKAGAVPANRYAVKVK